MKTQSFLNFLYIRINYLVLLTKKDVQTYSLLILIHYAHYGFHSVKYRGQKFYPPHNISQELYELNFRCGGAN